MRVVEGVRAEKSSCPDCGNPRCGNRGTSREREAEKAEEEKAEEGGSLTLFPCHQGESPHVENDYPASLNLDETLFLQFFQGSGEGFAHCPEPGGTFPFFQ